MVDIQFVKASDYCESVVDGTHDSPKPCDEGFYLITSKHLLDYEINFASAYKISEADYNLITKRSSVKQWDILLSMIGTVGRVYIERNSNSEYACKNVGIFKCGGDRYKALWLYYVLKSPYCKQYISKVLAGSTQSYISLGNLRAFPVPVIADEKRNRIIEALSTLDDKIEVNNKIIQNIDEFCRTCFNKAFSHLDKLKELKDICSIVMGQSPEGSSLNSKKQGTVFYQGCADFGIHYPNRRLYTTNPKRLAKKGDILLSVRAPVGRVNIANEDCCIGRGLATLKSSTPFFTLFSLYASRGEFATFDAEGTVFGSINKKSLEEIKIFNADDCAIEKFEKFSAPFMKKIFTLDLENRLLTNMRNALLPKLLSGEIELKNQ